MQDIVHGIKVDYSRDGLFDDLGIKRLKESYMKEDETSPQERFAYVSKAFGSNAEHSQRLYEYSSKHWLSYSTPILSYGRSKRGLPISCFLPYLHDSAEGLVDCLSEVNWLKIRYIFKLLNNFYITFIRVLLCLMLMLNLQKRITD